MASKMVLDALGFTPAESNSFGTAVQNLAALIALASDKLVDKQLRLVEDEGCLYRYDAESLLADDGRRVVKPAVIIGSLPGRWLLTIAGQDTDAAQSIAELKQINEDSGEPLGFVDRTKSTMSFNEATRTFTITPIGSFSYYIRGKKFTKSAAESIVINDVSGSWFIYYNEIGALAVSQSPWDLSKVAPICEVLWNASVKRAIMVAEERHGCIMDDTTHFYLHSTRGTQYINGLIAGNYTLFGEGNAETDTQFSISNGKLADEDLPLEIKHSATPSNSFEQQLSPVAKARCVYRSGLHEWLDTSATTQPYKVGTRLQYNKVENDSWTTVDASADGKFIAYWIVATNDMRSPIITMMGQREDDTLDEAVSNNSFSSLNFGTIPFTEYRTLYRVILQTHSAYINSAKAKIVDIIDVRNVSHIVLSTVATQDHGSLAGLMDDTHSQYVHKDIPRIITTKHTFEPFADDAPFALGPHAQGQKVAGLNADQLDGKSIEDFVLKETIGVNGGVQPYSEITSGYGRITTFTTSGQLTPQMNGTIRIDATAGDITLYLPLAGDMPGIFYWLKRLDRTENKVIVLPKAVSSDLINGETSYPYLVRYGDYAILQAAFAGRWGLFAKSDSPLRDQVGHITTPPSSAYTVGGYQLTVADAGFVRCNASNGQMIIILPPEKITAGYKYFFKKTDLTANKVTIRCVTGDTIEGWDDYELTVPREYVVFESCGLTNTWRIFASTPPQDKYFNWTSNGNLTTEIEIGRSMTGSHYVDAANGRVHMHLPPASEVPAQSYFVKKTDSSTNIVDVHVADNTLDTFDIGGNNSFELNTKGDYVRVASDGTTWRVMQQELHLNYGPPAYIDNGGTLISIARFHLPFFNSGNNLTSGLLLAYGANSQPQYMSRNYKIKSIRVSVGAALPNPVTFSIRLNGTSTNYYSVTLPVNQIGYTESALEILMNGSDTIQIFAQSVSRLNNPTCIIEYCWRN